MKTQYTEQAVANFFDAEGDIYRKFWDPAGSMHWGIFNQSTGEDFRQACENLDELMLHKADLQLANRLLDVGCGNGNTAIWLAKRSGAQVTGIDLSQVQVNTASSMAEQNPAETAARLSFRKASATELPYADGHFTHVWSQATFHRIPDREKALAEAYRVLQPKGILVFDALTSPREGRISLLTRKHCYDRLLCDTSPSFAQYHQILDTTGFLVLESQDLSPHLQRSYKILKRRPQSVWTQRRNA